MGKKGAYPVILKRTDEGYYVEIPDFDSGTQGSTVAEAMEMARDAIGLIGIDLEDGKKEIPKPYLKLRKMIFSRWSMWIFQSTEKRLIIRQ